MAEAYKGWDSYSAGLTEDQAIAECEQRGISFEAFATEVADRWEEMFPGEEQPDDLVQGIAKDLEQHVEWRKSHPVVTR